MILWRIYETALSLALWSIAMVTCRQDKAELTEGLGLHLKGVWG